uniref:C2H2-type domain-containing protein n=1 Tax=Timema tahoe TaxID=61484 RepID=A0A7R9ICE0_9NEOP|nr:unnamed protein product [Timema tahoe]
MAREIFSLLSVVGEAASPVLLGPWRHQHRVFTRECEITLQQRTSPTLDPVFLPPPTSCVYKGVRAYPPTACVPHSRPGEIEDSNKLLVENDLACDQTTESRGNCESCEYICKSEKRLERHQFGHTKSQTKSHPCTLCDESFILKAGLLCHLKTHNCDFSEKCYECDKTFSSVCDDENHTTTHHGEHATYVKCHVCCLTFRHQYFKQHAKTHKMNKYQCEICGVCLSLLSSLKVHKHAYHFKSKNFCCDQCGKTYLTNYRLTKHMSTHTGIKNYLCDVCGINFSILSNFQRHMLIHDNLRPFKCPICPYTCRQKVCLIAHMLCHSVLRPFKCSLCPYSCKQRSYLSNHMKCHTYNGKPFICGECEFSSHHKEVVLLHHLKIHNGVKSYADQTLENTYYTTEIKDLGGEEGEELWDSGKNASNQVATFQQPKLYPKAQHHNAQSCVYLILASDDDTPNMHKVPPERSNMRASSIAGAWPLQSITRSTPQLLSACFLAFSSLGEIIS